MVVVQLRGGMGNQLFQYALGRRLAIERNVPLKLDTSRLDRDPQRRFSLDCFSFDADIATSDDIQCTKGGDGIQGKLTRGLDRLKPCYRRHWVREQNLSFDSNVQNVPKSVYLQGYWQSERYFDVYAEVIRRDLQFREPPSSINSALAEEILQCDSVSVHIRRGDYVGNTKTNRMHGVCSEEYYRKAVDAIAAQFTSPHLYVFSDDIPWVREHLSTAHDMTYVDHNGLKNDYEDLRLMSLCRHHIIANSTFSWWGAWLNKNPSKIVIAPNKWYRSSEYESIDIVPDSWLRV